MKTMLTLPALLLLLAGPTQAALFDFTASLDGPSEAPPNGSAGTGFSTVTYDSVAHTLQVDFSFSGLMGTVTAAHIHAPTTSAGTGTASVATPTPTFPGTPTGVTSGSYSQTFDLTLTSSYNASFVTANGGTAAGAEAALIAALDAGKAYLNIHTSSFGGGEIRGFYAPVPEPAETAALIGGLSGLFALVRRQRSRKGQE